MAKDNNNLLAIVLTGTASLVSLVVLMKTIGAGRSPAVIAMAGLGLLIFLSLLIAVVVTAVKS